MEPPWEVGTIVFPFWTGAQRPPDLSKLIYLARRGASFLVQTAESTMIGYWAKSSPCLPSSWWPPPPWDPFFSWFPYSMLSWSSFYFSVHSSFFFPDLPSLYLSVHQALCSAFLPHSAVSYSPLSFQCRVLYLSFPPMSQSIYLLNIPKCTFLMHFNPDTSKSEFITTGPMPGCSQNLPHLPCSYSQRLVALPST